MYRRKYQYCFIVILFFAQLFLRVSWAQDNFTWDIDGDNEVISSKDGELVSRYLFGFRGDDLIEGLVNASGTRVTASAIETYLKENYDKFDIDNDGEIRPLTDGLLLMRYQLGQRNDTLINSIVGETGTRKTATDISNYIHAFYKGLPPVVSLTDSEYFSAQTLEISASDAGASIYYRFGTDAFQKYTSPISLVSGEHTLEYYLISDDGTQGETQTKTYIIWAVVDKNGGGDYPRLHDAVAAEEHRIWIKDGIYADSQTIEIEYSDVYIKGESQSGTILQKTTEGSLMLVVKTDHVTVENITLDAKTYDSESNRIWEAFGVFDSDYVTLKDSKVLGSLYNFAIYFAGPDVQAGQPTLDAFEENHLDAYNVVEGNTIISDLEGDVLSFSLQKYGKIINNHQTGGLISFYMNNNSVCNNNVVEDSNSVGIYLSIPAHNNEVDGNTIKNSHASGIRIERQSDHRVDLNNITSEILTPTTYRGLGNKITNNTIIDARLMGMEVVQSKGTIISGNRIEASDYNGIQVVRSDDVEIFNNTIVDAGQAKYRTPPHDFSPATGGVFMDQNAVNTSIHDNTIINSDKGGLDYAVSIAAWDTISGTSVVSNRFEGSFAEGLVSVGKNTDQANIHSNVVVP